MKKMHLVGIPAIASLLLVTGCSSLEAGTPTSNGDGGDFPNNEPVTIVLPYAAGGSSDTLVRALEPYLAEELGTDVIIENVVGAGGQLGLTQVANAEPNGHTIGLTNLPSSLAYLNPDKQAPYDGADFEPLGTINRFQWLLVTSKGKDWENLDDFIAAAKENPGAIAVGTDGLTGDDHMALLEFQRLTDTELKVVPFDDGSEKMTALMGNQIDASFGTVPTFSAQLETGDLKPLAALEEQSIESLEVETAADQGVDLQWDSFNVLSAPDGLPDNVAETLESAIESALAAAQEDPAFTEPMTNAGFVIEYSNAADTRENWDDLEATFKELMPLARGEQ
ncbi:tripartite tricarboxylate transporter substrate binding protein [Cellulosimicrobium funkei]|nr:tripartite tricarboxylate transporter substrate binding protein [Cellulosimicrobium funkei]